MIVAPPCRKKTVVEYIDFLIAINCVSAIRMDTFIFYVLIL